jgi:Flp pilus assembly protein TadG
MSNHIRTTIGDHSRAASIEQRRACVLLGAAFDLLRRFRTSESGNIAIIAAITLPLTAGAIGVAISYSTVNAVRSDMQAALDAAVLAGAVALDTIGGSDPITTANDVFTGNTSKFVNTEATKIAASFTATDPTVSGTASGSVVNPFGGLIGPKTIAVNVKAAATKLTTPICVLGLNGLDNGSFDINGSKATFAASCAVQANTNSKSGMTSEGQPTASAKKFGVVGGHKGDAFSPTPVDGSSQVADPYASLPFPTPASCTGKYNGNGKGLDISNDTMLSPGTYCGGVHIYGNSTHVTLQPGVYIMNDGPFWTDANSVVTGDQVLIAFTGTGAALQIWGDSNVTLTSPTSGTYMNMQFMQDPNDANSRGLWDSIGGSSGGQGGSAKLTFDGVGYFPTQNWWVFGNAVVNANSPSMAIVADKVWTQGSAYVSVTNQNPRNLNVAPPPQTWYGVKLIY